MKVLTLIQPWASLIALGEKMIETRSWQTNYRGPLLIHAGKKIDKDICLQEPFKSVLEEYGLTIDNLPTGVIIAKVDMVACQKIIEDDGICGITDGHLLIKGNEYYFGDYTPERYAWMLKSVELLKSPIPAKGQLNLWNFDYKE